MWNTAFNCCQNCRNDPYFFFMNPFAARNEAEKWADTPSYPNLSLYIQWRKSPHQISFWPILNWVKDNAIFPAYLTDPMIVILYKGPGNIGRGKYPNCSAMKSWPPQMTCLPRSKAWELHAHLDNLLKDIIDCFLSEEQATKMSCLHSSIWASPREMSLIGRSQLPWQALKCFMCTFTRIVDFRDLPPWCIYIVS